MYALVLVMFIAANGTIMHKTYTNHPVPREVCLQEKADAIDKFYKNKVDERENYMGGLFECVEMTGKTEEGA